MGLENLSEQHERNISELIKKFSHKIEAEVVREVYAAALKRYGSAASIQNFVPIIVRRETEKALSAMAVD